jgi:hypothetical protein
MQEMLTLRLRHLKQGCQMVYSHTKKSRVGYILEGRGMENVWYALWSFCISVVIWYILWSFGIFCGHLVYFVIFWYILKSFGIFCGHLVRYTDKNLATLL